MNDDLEPGIDNHPLPEGWDGAQVGYLLKELEFQVAIESKARDRAEQMVAYLLTSIAAIIGAVLLIAGTQADPLLIAFMASLLVLVFGVFSFYRLCRLRNAITHARINRRRIRRALVEAGVSQAERMSELEESLTGFTPRMLRTLRLLAALCGLLGGSTSGLGAALIGSAFGQRYQLWFNGVFFLLGFLVVFIWLMLILRNYRLAAIHMMSRVGPGLA